MQHTRACPGETLGENERYEGWPLLETGPCSASGNNQQRRVVMDELRAEIFEDACMKLVASVDD